MNRSFPTSHASDVAVQMMAAPAPRSLTMAALVPGLASQLPRPPRQSHATCTTNAEVLDALGTHEFVFARLMGFDLADALGCAYTFLSWPPVLALDQLWSTNSPSFTGITPEANAEGPENADYASNGAVVENANPADPDTSQLPRPKLPQEKSVLFDAVTCLDAQLTTLHAALPPRTAFLIFSSHSDPRVMSALAARRSEFQASLNQN